MPFLVPSHLSESNPKSEVSSFGFFLVWLTVNPAEDHSPGGCLQDAGHGDADFGANGAASLLDDDHRAVVEIADALTDLVALFDDSYRQVLAGERHELEGVGQLVQVDDVHALQLANLVQVEVVGDDASADGLGQNDQALVHLRHFAELGQVGLVHVQINLRVGLHAFEDVQAPSSAVPLDLVSAVGNALQLLEYKARHDQLGVDNPRITNIGNPAVYDDTRVQDQRSGPFNLFGELDIRNNEAELLF